MREPGVLYSPDNPAYDNGNGTGTASHRLTGHGPPALTTTTTMVTAAAAGTYTRPLFCST
jgi:hypothetical protein